MHPRQEFLQTCYRHMALRFNIWSICHSSWSRRLACCASEVSTGVLWQSYRYVFTFLFPLFYYLNRTFYCFYVFMYPSTDLNTSLVLLPYSFHSYLLHLLLLLFNLTTLAMPMASILPARRRERLSIWRTCFVICVTHSWFLLLIHSFIVYVLP